MKPKAIKALTPALFLAVFMLFSGALQAKAAAALFDRGGRVYDGEP